MESAVFLVIRVGDVNYTVEEAIAVRDKLNEQIAIAQKALEKMNAPEVSEDDAE